MAESSALSVSSPRSRVVRSLARAAERPCARPGCPAPARATLTFVYATGEVQLDRLVDQPDPQGYDLCAPHASRTQPPRGWELTDRRPDDDRAASEAPSAPVRDLGGEATVALLAAALRAVPEPAEPSEPARIATASSAPEPAEPAGTGLEPAEGAAAPAEAAAVQGVLVDPAPEAAADPEPAPAPAPDAERRRRSVVETLLSAGGAGVAEAPTARRDTRREPTVELPRMRAPRRVPAAGDRGPATDW